MLLQPSYVTYVIAKVKIKLPLHFFPNSNDFPINSKQDVLFHHTAYGYSGANWDILHLRDVLWEDISKLSAAVAASEFL